jgi:HD-GYP domain-containing protein (c-di-GMP phosphodiesterase class II)
MAMKQHPVVADRILGPLPFLREVRPLVRHHHERLNGSGYPDGLQEGEIDLLTMILAVADSYDAMTSRRSYRPTLYVAEAVAELKRCSGVLFRVDVVQGLIAALDDIPLALVDQTIKKT